LVTADLIRGFSLIVYGTRIFKVGLFDFLWNAYARAVTLISLLIAGISLLNIPAPDWFRLILLGCLGAAVFAVLGFFLVLPQSMRIRLYEAVISVWRSIAGRLGKKPATPSNE
jgi:hypothetical protein